MHGHLHSLHVQISTAHAIIVVSNIYNASSVESLGIMHTGAVATKVYMTIKGLTRWGLHRSPILPLIGLISVIEIPTSNGRIFFCGHQSFNLSPIGPFSNRWTRRKWLVFMLISLGQTWLGANEYFCN